MRPVLAELVELLELERLEENLFRGQSQDLGWGNVFGGQVLGQALSAAQQTVPEGRVAHSLHGYFLRTGDASKPIVYDVDCIRDGKSFTTRRVRAIQFGRAIFNMSASFQKEEEGLDHQDDMPDAPGPNELKNEQQLAELIADKIPSKYRERVLSERPIEIRPIELDNPLRPKPAAPYRRLWYRAVDPLADAVSLHQYLLAYASDFKLLGTSMMPHGVSFLQPDMQVASLDHAMWFHRPFRFDDWLLYEMDSPTSSGARGLAKGRFFDREGRLVASCVQEGLIRQWKG